MTLYYGLWHSIYKIPWFIRIFVEILLYLLILYALFKLLQFIGKYVPIKKYIVYACVFVVTFVLGLFGSDREWAVRADEKIQEWGRQQLEGNYGLKDRTKHILFAVIAIIYVFAIFPDLPVKGIVNSFYMEKLSGTKRFFIGMESWLSDGYEEYPELFVPEEKSEPTKKPKAGKKIYLKLNKEGKKGAKLRKKPLAKAKVVRTVKKGDRIVYQNVWKKEGKRYWLKVYLPKKKIGGWINAQMIERSQYKSIINAKRKDG